MNKNIIRILCASIALTLILNGIFTVSAKTYVTNIISGNFESADECKFLIWIMNYLYPVLNKRLIN